MQQPSTVLLSKEQIEAQISTLDLLMAMYPSEDEITLSSETSDHLDTLRTWCTSHDDTGYTTPTTLSTLSLELTVTIDTDTIEISSATTPTTIQLSIELPLHTDKTEVNPEDPNSIPAPRVRLRQPNWMNKTQTSQVNTSAPPPDTDDILATIEHFRTSASQHFQASSSLTTTSTSTATPNSTSTPTPLVRVWFYFPSLSTRSKRSDLVTYAATYDLTGFVLAGKPGLLCLEGHSARIDEYMSFIKTESWSDIPSAHKKVSERVRDQIETRVFLGMREITGEEGIERRGERGNRNDLRALEGWLDGFGLGGMVGRVVM